MTLQQLHAGSTVWCVLRPAAVKAVAVEAVVVQPGDFQSVLACPPQHEAHVVELHGSPVAFYYVNNRHLCFTKMDDVQRMEDLKAHIDGLVSCFSERSDAVFMPTQALHTMGTDVEVPSSVEVCLAKDHRLFLWNSFLI
eukprot:symbB.v1.2.008831.t1/scaffold556.1/size187764/2